MTEGGVEGSDVHVAVPLHVPKLSQRWNKETSGEKSPQPASGQVLLFISTIERNHLEMMVVVPQKHRHSVCPDDLSSPLVNLLFCNKQTRWWLVFGLTLCLSQ